MKAGITGMALALTISIGAWAQKSRQAYPLPDSVKAVSYITTASVTGTGKAKAGISAGTVSAALRLSRSGGCTAVFAAPKEAIHITAGEDVQQRKGSYSWVFTPGDSCRLLIASAADSAGNFTLCSGYVYLYSTQKWKLLGTVKLSSWQPTLKNPETFTSSRSSAPALTLSNTWCQRSNGSWKPLSAGANPPVLAPFSNTDSAAQAAKETALLQSILPAAGTDTSGWKEGICYTILKQGSGSFVKLSDTVSVYYRGYLYESGDVFDETKDKPARFPLARLIKGWQSGLTLCRVGGKIKLIIPSGQAYGIRTRAAKIPPNSILVFEIEVTDAVPAKQQ